MRQDELSIDPAIVAALYVQHADELRRFLLGVLRDHDLAGEALQATFVKAVEVGHTAEHETLKAWLFRVAYHEAIALRRKQSVRDRANERLGWLKPTTVLPEDRLVRWETVENVRAALQELSGEQRQVVSMRVYDEKTFATIATELGVPLGTVLSRMQAALRKLRGSLDPM